jgi:hypothetical protein
MKQQMITNDIARKSFLQTAVLELANPNRTLTSVPNRFVQYLNRLELNFAEAKAQSDESRREFKNQKLVFDAAMMALTHQLRFAYASIRMHAKSNHLSRADLERCGLSVDGYLSLIGNNLERVADVKARQLLDAELAIATVPEPPDDSDLPAPPSPFSVLRMVPNGDAIEMALAELEVLREALAQARATADQAMRNLQQLRREVREAFVNLRAYLMVELRGIDPISTRNVLRAFGYRFKGASTTGEEEPTDVSEDDVNSEEPVTENAEVLAA